MVKLSSRSVITRFQIVIFRLKSNHIFDEIHTWLQLNVYFNEKVYKWSSANFKPISSKSNNNRKLYWCTIYRRSLSFQVLRSSSTGAIHSCILFHNMMTVLCFARFCYYSPRVDISFTYQHSYWGTANACT